MSYIRNNLMTGEQIIYQAKVHWFVFIPSLIWLSLGIVFFNLGAMQDGWLTLAGFVLILTALISFVRALIVKLSTELAVTSKRVMVKTGYFSIQTIELNHSKVESFNVLQSFIGSLFNFGTVIVSGTGGGKTPIPNIDAPLDFRYAAVQAIDASQP